ncbi:unnamed protein product [Rotaria sp. Silwood1]|nr:unnamed protein product [Rotaria sp. Silwood1]CAF0855530.1 unnamed protein product [Rotaria sp. Silwood1]
MAINANSNLLLGAGHYQHHAHYQKILTDPVIHIIENNHPDDHQSLPAQSLQTIFCLEPQSTSISYPHFQESSANQISTSTSPLSSNAPPISLSMYKNTPLNSSLYRIDNLCSRQVSVSRAFTQDESISVVTIYAISSIVALCIINIFHGIISYFYYNQIYLTASQPSITTNEIHHSLYPEYSLCRLDRYAFFIFCSLFFIYQILILLCTIWIPYKRRCAMRYKDEKTRAQLTNTTTVEMTK